MRWVRGIVAAALVFPVGEATAREQSQGDSPVVTPQRSWRFELGARLRELDRAWLDSKNPERRSRALPLVDAAVGRFFLGQSAATAKALDEAVFALRDVDPDARTRWAAGAWARPVAAVIGTQATTVEIDLGILYEAREGVPSKLRLEVRIDPSTATIGDLAIPLGASAARIEVPEGAEGDANLEFRVLDGGGTLLRTFRAALARVDRFEERLEALESILSGAGTRATRVARGCLRQRVEMLRALRTGRQEIDLPALRLLRAAESGALALAAGKEWPRFVGDGYVATELPRRAAGAASRASTASPIVPARAFVTDPDGETMVVALHGAGGSENLFFEAYGGGRVVELARARGWNVLAPNVHRAGERLAEAVDDLVKAVAPRTKRLYVVGHSMGAIAASRWLAGSAGASVKIEAVAMISGGVDTGAALDGVPLFLAAGARDFARGGVERLSRELERRGADSRLRIYEAEHLLVVADALPDVFLWLDTLR